MSDGGRVPDDGAFMRRALSLAERAWGQTAPNPMVGAVVVRDDTVVGEGWHTRYGAADSPRYYQGVAYHRQLYFRRLVPGDHARAHGSRD